MKWGDSFSLKLNNPLTTEEWAMLNDYEMDNTTAVTFHTPNGKDVMFVKPICCKDCTHYDGEWCFENRHYLKDYDFCSRAERREVTE